jgi:PilZ domain
MVSALHAERFTMPQTQFILRRHQRVLVPEGHFIRAEAGNEGCRIEGVVSVVGLGGVFLRTRSSRPVGTPMHLKLAGPLAALEFDCAVRYVGDNGLGFEITSIAPLDEQKLKFLLLQLKA